VLVLPQRDTNTALAFVRRFLVGVAAGVLLRLALAPLLGSVVAERLGLAVTCGVIGDFWWTPAHASLGRRALGLACFVGFFLLLYELGSRFVP